MESTVYIQQAIRTESVPETLNINPVVLDAVLKLSTNAAQVADLAKRRMFYGKDIDAQTLSNLLFNIKQSVASLNLLTANNTLNYTEMISGEGDPTRINVRLMHCAIGCFTESGELLESILKQFQTGELDAVNFGEEVGDIEWYQAIGFDESKVSEASCREKNIAKLRKRYPEKFTELDALNRDLGAEREVLEGLYEPDSAAVRDTRGE